MMMGDIDEEPTNEVESAKYEHDLADMAPEAAVSESLRNALEAMRDESHRIAELETGEAKVDAAENIADAAGSLDEQIGAAARAADDDDRN